MNNPYLETLEPVWENLNYVFVQKEKLEELKEKFAKEELGVSILVPTAFEPSIDCRPVFWINFICWVNAMAFAFTNFEPPYGKFTIRYPKNSDNPEDWPRGSFALRASFIRAHRDGIPVFNTNYLANISLGHVRFIFRSIDYHHRIPMIEERWRIFREVGQVLLERYNGRWINLFEESDWRAFNNGKGIAEQLVANFPSFRDQRLHRPTGRLLQFQKRAQLLPLAHHRRALNSDGKLPLIKDIQDIGPICDYEIPKALRFLGVLQYHPWLEAWIQRREIILPGSLEEIELRLGTAYCMDYLFRGRMAVGDSLFWQMVRGNPAPHHLTRTIDY